MGAVPPPGGLMLMMIMLGAFAALKGRLTWAS